MKSHHYVFARIFVNFAIFFAILTALAGVGAAIIRIGQMNSEIARATYRPTSDLLDAVAALKKNLVGTRHRLLQTMNRQDFPTEQLQISAIPPDSNPLSGLSPEQVPSACLQLVVQVSEEVDRLKEYHSAELHSSIFAIQEALLEHARTLKATYPTSPTPTPTPAPTTAKGSSVPQRVSVQRPFRIFSDPYSNDRLRFDDIQTMRELLAVLAENSQEERNLRAIGRAQRYLNSAPALLDLSSQFSLPPPAPAPSINARSQSPPPPEPPKAEIIAAKLGDAKSILASSLYSNWVIDEDTERLRRLAEENTALIAQLADTRQQSLQEGVKQAGIYAVLGAVVAFLVMVIADLIRAFLNLSNNTDTLAVAQIKRDTNSE
jgi:hypothetical protein